MDYFTADVHAFHEKIIKYSKRPFNDLQHMHDEIINNWNRYTSKDDNIWVVGDFVYPLSGPYAQKKFEFVKSLNGHIHVVLGDHDTSADFYRHCGINVHKDVYVIDRRREDKPSIALCHWPIRIWPRSHYGAWHLFGHIHNNNRTKPFDEYYKSFNVGMDVWDYQLVSLNQVTEKMGQCQENPNFIPEEKRRKS